MSKSKQLKNATMVDVIESGEDGVFETQHLLARVWRIVLIKTQVSGDLWYRLISRHQEKHRHLESNTKRTSIKGNYSRQLAKNKISWSLLMKGFEIMEFEEIKVEFKFKKGPLEFTIPMTLKDKNNDLDLDEPSEDK